MKQIVGKQASKLADIFVFLSILFGIINLGFGICVSIGYPEMLIPQLFSFITQFLFLRLTFRARDASVQPPALDKLKGIQ